MKQWLEPATARSLGIMRALFFGYFLVRVWEVDWAIWGRAPAVFWNPHPTFSALGIRPASESTLALFGLTLKAGILACCLGFLTRFSTWLVALLSFYLFGLECCYGSMTHDLSVLVLALFVLACSRCGDAFSLDARLWGGRQEWPERHFAYAWPPFMIQLLLCNMFFWAGVSKLTAAGLSWGSPAELKTVILVQSLLCSDAVAREAGVWILQHLPWLLSWIGPLTLALEVAMPLALLSPRLKLVFGVLGFSFLVAVRVTLGPIFLTTAGLFVFWLPWSSRDNRGEACKTVSQRAAPCPTGSSLLLPEV